MIFLAGTLILILVILSFGFGRISKVKEFAVPTLQAHRGHCVSNGQIDIPENTIASLRMAHRMGYEMAECDLRLSQDGKVFLCHDENLERVFQRPYEVSELHSNQLLEIGLTPLEDVLRDSEVPVKLNLELKSDAIFDASLERAVATTIIKYEDEFHKLHSVDQSKLKVRTDAGLGASIKKRILISSFNPLCLLRVSLLCPEPLRALLLSCEPHPKNRWFLRWGLLFNLARADVLHLDERYFFTSDSNPDGVPKSFYRIHCFPKFRVLYSVWTVNDSKKSKKLLEAGALSIITDKIRIRST